VRRFVEGACAAPGRRARDGRRAACRGAL